MEEKEKHNALCKFQANQNIRSELGLITYGNLLS